MQPIRTIVHDVASARIQRLIRVTPSGKRVEWLAVSLINAKGDVMSEITAFAVMGDEHLRCETFTIDRASDDLGEFADDVEVNEPTDEDTERDLADAEAEGQA